MSEDEDTLEELALIRMTEELERPTDDDIIGEEEDEDE